MGKSNKNGQKSSNEDFEDDRDSDIEDVHFSKGDVKNPYVSTTFPKSTYKHPADKASCWSYATFSWLSSLMYSSYRYGFDPSKIQPISLEDSSHLNTDTLERLIHEQKQAGQVLSFNRIIWKFAKRRILLTSIVHFICIFLGFLVPTVFMKKLLDFARDSETTIWDGVFWLSLFVLCELARVFFFTLTWALSYRTGIRLKVASMGLVFRKILRVRQINDKLSAVLSNIISSDCSRIYDVVISTQMALGGPVVLIFSIFYIAHELGFLPLIGLLVFPLSYPLQIVLAKTAGFFKGKAISIRDNRLKFLSQAIRNMKFLKMFAWEKYYRGIIAEVREQEKRFLRKAQLVQSLSICITPALPHIGAIITFILYVNTGRELTATQAFCILGLFAGRLKPSIAQFRSAMRAYFDARISFRRIECFTLLFLFALFGYSIRSVQQIITFYYIYRIYIERMEYVLRLPELDPSNKLDSESDPDLDPIIFDEVKIVRRAPQSESIVNPPFNSKIPNMSKIEKKELKQRRKEYEAMNIDQFIKAAEPEIVTFQLEPVSLQIKKGSFIGICGNIGAGKSTLLKTIAGGLPVDCGNLEINSGLVYVSQEPWIFKGTIQDNILFGEPCDPLLYYSTLYSCCLLDDIGTLPHGDKTNAFNLSGGQQQRVCLARALYHSKIKDVYLLDDPFCSLDGKVGKIVFSRLVNDQLKKLNKTIILVTHQLQYLQNCDEILVFNDGKIVERGSHSELLSDKNSQYFNLASGVQFYEEGIDNENNMLEDSPMLDCSVTLGDIDYNDVSGGTQKTRLSRGSISKDVYTMYIQNAGGYVTLLIVLLAFALSVASITFSSWWLKDWLSNGSPTMLANNNSSGFGNGNGSNPEDYNSSSIWSDSKFSNGVEEEPEQVISINSENFSVKRDIFAGIIALIIVTCLMRAIIFTYVSVKASHGLHCLMLSHLFRSRVKSTEKIGVGQITNLFSKDMDEVDYSLPNSMEFFLQNVFIVLSILIVVTAVFPIFLLPLTLLCGIFYFLRRVYQGAIRDLKRLESETKSPIFTIVQETSTGLDTIRAYGKEKQILKQYEKLSDEYHSVYYVMISSMRWLSIRLDALAVAVTGITATLILIFHGYISPASAGLALSYAAQLSGVFQFTVRLASETETKFVCVERMKTFLRQSVLEEPELFSAENIFKKPENLLLVRSMDNIQHNWPYQGKVKFDSVYFGYSNKSMVLKNISFEIEPGQKIGIIGRTGSGKSSIGCALFRLAELRSGQILIDDIDISDVSLSKLRTSLCVIPQDPAIIQNSIRFNLDPGKTYSDEELWDVLEKTGLKDAVEFLDAEVGLSQGQKQLLSIARAILRHSKVVFIDEATANIDSETSASIDRLLVQEFHSSTVFIVAHRQSAVKYCDHLLVLDQGEIKNFGPADVIRRAENFNAYFDLNDLA